MGYKVKDVEEMRKNLEKMPELNAEDEEVSTKDAIRLLRPTIEELVKRRYKISAIADELKKSGLEISTSTLKSYLSQTSTTKKRKRSRSGEKLDSTSPLKSSAKLDGVVNK